MKAKDIYDLLRIKFSGNTKLISQLRRSRFGFRLQEARGHDLESISSEVVEVVDHTITTQDAIKLDDYVGAASSSSPQLQNAGNIDVVGLNEDLIQILTHLCGDSSQLQFIPITGMGGIGKTTLARNAYDHQLIIEHFQIRAWLTISQDYSEGRILSTLLDAMKEFYSKKEIKEGSAREIDEEGDEKTGEDSKGKIDKESEGKVIQESDSEKAVKVYKTLVGRKFLIVMDDVWSTKVLDDVKKFLPNDNNRSRILLTTRLADVAAYASSSTPSHEMRLMNADQSWNLVRQLVLKHQDHIPCELENTGKEIARSCGGLPLAMVAVGGILSTVAMSLTSWEEIARNVKSTLATNDEWQIEKILSLSYNHLPHYLRPCFLYLAAFPEDHEIKVADLMRLWIAEGFVKQVAQKSYEESAEEYMEDLIKRSLVVVSKSMFTGKIKSCKLHDLVRDLCIKISQEEKFLVHIEGKMKRSAMKDVQRISISHSDVDSLTNISSTIRTILFFQHALDSFGSSQLLRVLDVSRVAALSDAIAHQFFKLVRLRYLAFSCTGRIPRAISNLQYLQTLIITGWNDMHIPCEIWNMLQLRHVNVFSRCHFDDPHGTTMALENLQTLGRVKNLSLRSSILCLVPNLKKLSVIYCWGFTDEFLFHNLVHLRRLEKLKLEVDSGISFSHNPLHSLVVPSWLKKLTLVGWDLGRRYLNIVGPLPSLEVLKLREFDFMQQEWTTGEEDFPRLKSLLIYRSDLKEWKSEGSHFPRLEHLLIHSCPSLREIPDDFGDIPTLKLIEIKNCSRYLEDCVRLTQEEQLNYGDDVFQLRISGFKIR